MGNQTTCCGSQDGQLPSGCDVGGPQQQGSGLFLGAIAFSEQNPEDDTWREAAEKTPHTQMLDSRDGGGSAHSSGGLRSQLLQATRADDAPSVLQCVADGATNPDMTEALRLAAHRGCASVVRELVAVGLAANEACPTTGFTPLHLASASGHLAACELLLDALADVHKSVGGASALNLARKMGHADVEEVLERHAASLVLADSKKDGEEAAPSTRRAHVVPRISATLSEAVLQALPTIPSKPEGEPTRANANNVPTQLGKVKG